MVIAERVVTAAAARSTVPFAPLDTAVIAAVLVAVLLAVRWQRRRVERSVAPEIHPSRGLDQAGRRAEPTETAARR